MFLRRFAGAALVAVFVSVPIAASAGQNSSIEMSESVVANCSAIPTSFSVNLPDYDPLNNGWPGWTINSSQFQCTKGSTPLFSFDNGTNGTTGDGLRKMGDGSGHTLTYLSWLCFQPFLYHTYNEVSNSKACLNTWPAAAASNQNYITAYPTGNGGTEIIYLSLMNVIFPSGQDATVGHYTDSYTATLNY